MGCGTSSATQANKAQKAERYSIPQDNTPSEATIIDALKRNDADFFKNLFSGGVYSPISVFNKENQKNLFHLAAEMNLTQILGAFVELLDDDDKRIKSDLELRDSDGNTPLISAATKSSSDALQFLIKQNVDIEAVNKLGKSAIEICSENDDQKTLSLIEEKIFERYPKLKEDPRFKKFFVFKEKLKLDESDKIEYKGYSLPLFPMEYTIKKVICSFLNRRGGRLYIGINDDKEVYGIKLLPKDRDDAKLFFQNTLSTFYPDIQTAELIKTYFIPVKDFHGEAFVPHCYIIKVVVKQGNPNKLYSVRKEILECYIRNDGQCKYLAADLCTENILERSKKPVKREIFEYIRDPDPEIPPEPATNFNPIIEPEPKVNNPKSTVAVFVKVPKGLNEDEYKEVIEVNKYNPVNYKMLKTAENLSTGFSFVNFLTPEEAGKFIEDMNRKTYKGFKIESNLK